MPVKLRATKSHLKLIDNIDQFSFIRKKTINGHSIYDVNEEELISKMEELLLRLNF